MISVCLVIVLLIGIGSYAYVSDYYHADETALTVMSQADPVGRECDMVCPGDAGCGADFLPRR